MEEPEHVPNHENNHVTNPNTCGGDASDNFFVNDLKSSEQLGNSDDRNDILKSHKCLKDESPMNGKILPKIDNGIVNHILTQEIQPKPDPPASTSFSRSGCEGHQCSDANCGENITDTTDAISNIQISDEASDCEERDVKDGLEYVVYESELQMPDIMKLITRDLSEPYSIYTYRYFIHNWPKLCFLAMDEDKCVGAIVCKLDMHKKMVRRGYIAMLAIDAEYRRRKIGSHLVLKAIQAMMKDDCDEVVLETEITNRPALKLYENLGFVRDKRLFRYYLNGVDALRLKLWLR
ncbi:hypothetical protein ScPMuIL_014648 [Solemya velum]